MSREIDTSDLDSLSKEDLLYLQERGQLTAEQEAKYGLDKSTATSTPTGFTEPDIGDVGTVGDEYIVGGSPPPEPSAEGKPYEDWSKAELAEEAENRGLAKSGTKEELVARLQEDDEAQG